ncbi:MAG: ECF transporter S component [Rikenellaceae bacterium]|nr:ECF transporter S component [Rikenellaceae bacterium]
MEQSVKLYSLSLKQSKTFFIAGGMIAGNVILPAVCHLIPQGGLIFLPIYFFTLLGAYKYGIKVGLLIGLLSPVMNYLLTGMPPVSMLAPIMVKSVLLAVIASYAAKRFGKFSILILLSVVAGYQLMGTAFEWVYTGSIYMALQDFRMAVPGMLLQVFGVYAILKTAARYGI